MQRHKLAQLIIVFSLFLQIGCVPQSPPTPPKSQLEIREFQTRTYPSKALIVAMKAVINALQDDNFIIKNADKDLGFIQATKEIDIEDSTDRIFSTLFAGDRARWRKNSIVECSVNLTTLGSETKVRAIFQTKTLDNFGNPLNINVIEDQRYYQDFFSKVDKSIFIEKQGI